ncbi:hypothetical protein EFL95_16425 [Nocardioides marmorisolisilvae]|uniref:Uncharacterized protein n=1 Tax=Nocardioides marmorisolisilvae TaxID=1542737 RepID=A0A3N0DPN1_9ACTN|nr:hypothetical protein EFL95_16425 [Nocardioides marmorisolisilvae]
MDGGAEGEAAAVHLVQALQHLEPAALLAVFLVADPSPCHLKVEPEVGQAVIGRSLCRCRCDLDVGAARLEQSFVDY